MKVLKTLNAFDKKAALSGHFAEALRGGCDFSGFRVF